MNDGVIPRVLYPKPGNYFILSSVINFITFTTSKNINFETRLKVKTRSGFLKTFPKPLPLPNPPNQN